MARTSIDHLVVTADSLEAGAAFVSEVLGVVPQSGGEHPRMATYNRLLRLGDTMYLEVIAANPAAAAPPRPRWFDLDRLGPQTPPRLSAWVVRTTDIDASVAAASESLGAIESMSRGALNWQISMTPDGSVPLQGAAPALIEWQTDIHPAARMKDSGLSLARLDIMHPEPERLLRLLASLELDAPVSVLPAAAGVAAQLVAHINTPNGIRVLSAHQPAPA